MNKIFLLVLLSSCIGGVRPAIVQKQRQPARLSLADFLNVRVIGGIFA